MNKLILTALLVLSATFSASAQYALSWTKESLMAPTAFFCDKQGNTYAAGYLFGSVDADPGPGVFMLNGSLQGLDVWVRKLDANGNFAWAASFGGNDYDFAEALTVDDSGNVYITGNYSFQMSLSNLGGTSMSGDEFDLYLLKLKPDGTLAWALTTGSSPAYESGWGLATDDSCNVYLGGTGGGSIGTNILPAAFVVKLDPGGNYMWAQGGGTLPVYAGNGVVYTYGGGTIQKRNTSNGTSQWSSAISGIDITACMPDAFGNVYASGYFENTTDFDPGPGTLMLSSAGGRDGFLYKLNAAGGLCWAYNFGSAGHDEVFGGVTGYNDTLYLLGCFRNTVDLDPGAGTMNVASADDSSDIFVQKLDSSGNLVWLGTVSGAGNDVGSFIGIDTANSLYLFGVAGLNADLDPGSSTTTIGTNSGFNMKWHDNSAVAISAAPGGGSYSVSVYPNPVTASAEVRFHNPLQVAYEFALYNALGQKVSEVQNITSDKFTLRRNDLPAGFYYYQLSNGSSKAYTGKVVIE